MIMCSGVRYVVHVENELLSVYCNPACKSVT